MVSGCQMVSEYIDTPESSHEDVFLGSTVTTQDADDSHQQDDIFILRSGDPQPNYNPSFGTVHLGPGGVS